MPRVSMVKPAATGGVGMSPQAVLTGPQRFLSVIPIPAPSINTNDVSRSGLVVIASM